jgi:hypothetical protein
LKLLLLCLLLIACSREKPADIEAPRLDELAAKKAFYCEQGKIQYDLKKYMVGRCDGLLFTSLWSVSCGYGDVADFQDPGKPGYWHRNPTRDCYVAGAPNPDNGAKSSISRDMLLGLFTYAWKLKSLPIIQGLISYGESHTWIMGDAIDAKTLISRTVLTPELINLLYDMESRLSLQAGEDNSDDAFYINKGFQAHLDVIKILLTGSVKGSVTSIQANILGAQANRQPLNPLYVAAAARYGKYDAKVAVDFLLDNPHFPNDRLPSKAEHCEPYLFQRDADDGDWKPCGTDAELHDGTDFVVAASIIDGSL